MSLETQQTYVGKTQAIHVSELQSEVLIFGARLAIGFAYTVLSLIGLILGKIQLGTFLVGLAAVFMLCGISAMYLQRLRQQPIRGYSAYALVFLDVTFITAIIWSHAIDTLYVVHSALFCAYFVVITFTALHYRTGLVIFGGVLSALEYGLFYFWYISRLDAVPHDSVTQFSVQMGILLLVCVLSIVISRNNLATVQKVVSSESRYQNLVHRLPEMLFTLDRNTHFMWANMASYSLLGIPAKAIRHRSIADFFVNPAALRLDGSGLRGTFEIRDFEENRKFVDCVIQPVSDDKDTDAAYEGIMTDVTDRELAITQREEMVKRLFQYQKMESLGTLASGMAHDFNNILQTISDVSAMVKAQSQEVETRNRMSLISDTLTDARFLVSELLALGQKTALDYTSINLQEFLSDSVPLFGEQLGLKYHTNIDIADEPLMIKGNKDYLKRILQNLFTNARDAMPHGGTITTQCFAERREGEIGSIVLRFCDTGTGIPPDIQGKIFDPFFTTKKPGKGTGLGLALVQRIVSLHNGNVAIEKTSPAGTVFRITFPEIDSTEVDNDTKWIQANRIDSRLLLLDDDPKIRDILKFFLRELGYNVCEATNLEEGTAELAKHMSDCNVLIMDWKLGDMDPHRVITSLRAVKKELIVIVVSGYPPNQRSIEEMHIHKWFTKPYDKNQLDVEIQRALYLAKDKS